MRILTSASVVKVNGSVYKRALFYSAHAFIIMSTNSTLLGTFVYFFKSLWHMKFRHIQQKCKGLINETVDEKFHEYVGPLLMKLLSTSSFPIVVLNVVYLFVEMCI